MATKKVLVDEILSDRIYFEFDGVKYNVPVAKFWPLEVIEAQEDGKTLGAVKALLGEDQYKTFRSKPRTMDDLRLLMEAAFESVDVDPKD